ncbi:MAG: hypothetical protein ACRDL2_03775 [Gaiellaceae bacterium]
MSLRLGIPVALAAAALAAAAALGAAPGVAVGAPLVLDPGCTASAAGPGVVVTCLKEDHEGVTAAGFSDHSCDQVTGRDASRDYFIFVLPASGDPGRFFTTPAPTVYFDSGTTSGTIASNTKFFFASAPAGATLLEAVANADNGTGTPNGGEAQVFNLTHTCPATPPPPDTSPPACKLLYTTTGPPKSITVEVQDTGSGLETVVATTHNADAPVPPFTTGTTGAITVTATKIDQSQGATLELTVTDVAGNQTVCDPIFGAAVPLHAAILRAGGRVAFPGLAARQAHLLLAAKAGAHGTATVTVDGRRYAIVRLGKSERTKLDLGAALSAGRRHVVVVSLAGGGRILVRLTK